MKKILLASSALVAAAFVGSAASAAEKVTASLGGYMYAGLGYNDKGFGPGNQVDDIGVLRDGEIHFGMRGTSDNGLTFDGRVELEAWSQGGDIIDENWVRMSGSFGSVKIGGDDHASYNLSTGILFFAGAHIGHYDAFGESGGPLAFVTNNRFGDGVSIAYNTPVFSGFQAQVSYAPNSGADGGGDNNSLVVSNINQGSKDIISVGLNYNGTFSDVNVRVSGGYDYIDDVRNAAAFVPGNGQPVGLGSEDAFMAGLQFGYMGFRLGGHYKEAISTVDSDDYVVNADYTTGPWNFGVGYTNADNGTYTMDKFAGWVNYALAPGVSVGAGVEYQDTSGPGGGAPGSFGSEGMSAMAILSLSF